MSAQFVAGWEEKEGECTKSLWVLAQHIRRSHPIASTEWLCGVCGIYSLRWVKQHYASNHPGLRVPEKSIENQDIRENQEPRILTEQIKKLQESVQILSDTLTEVQQKCSSQELLISKHELTIQFGKRFANEDEEKK